MRKAVKFIAWFVTLALAGLYFLSAPDPLPAAKIPAYSVDIKNGETMYHAGGCASCHAAPGSAEGATDKTKKCDDPRSKNKMVLSGGRCLKTKFGKFIVPNISPHKTAGIGSWTKLEFVNAMLRGISPGGQHYYPVFPYTSYHQMAIEDVLDLKSYMDTLPPSNTTNKSHDLEFPYSVRRFIGLWKWLKFEAAKPGSRKDIGESLAERGRYLVRGPGHCGQCHTPRDALGGLLSKLALSGAPNASGKGWVPNITSHKSGLKAWSENQIADLLATGLTPEFDSIGGDMVAVQENMKEIGASNRAAIAHYLKSLKPIEGIKRPPGKKK